MTDQRVWNAAQDARNRLRLQIQDCSAYASEQTLMLATLDLMWSAVMTASGITEGYEPVFPTMQTRDKG